jgi:lipopolysaccharide transport protein LptA
MHYFLILTLICFFSFQASAQESNNAAPIEVTADNELKWNRADRIITAEGNAVVRQGADSIAAPTITALYNENDAIEVYQVTAAPNATLIRENQELTAYEVVADFDNGELSQVTANGDVILQSEGETLYGDKAIYDTIEQTVVITGNVRIEQGQNILEGNRAVFDLTTNISTMTGGASGNDRVRAVFYGRSAD